MNEKKLQPIDIIDIFTDGACKGNPGKGGWGALLRWREHEKELFGGEHQTTNNRMELRAVIESLRALKGSRHVRVHTDSRYVQRGISEWLDNWKRNHWQTSAKKPVKNQDLWQLLDELSMKHQIEWIWVKGHAGHVDNTRADALANRGVDSLNDEI